MRNFATTFLLSNISDMTRSVILNGRKKNSNTQPFRMELAAACFSYFLVRSHEQFHVIVGRMPLGPGCDLPLTDPTKETPSPLASVVVSLLSVTFFSFMSPLFSPKAG